MINLQINNFTSFDGVKITFYHPHCGFENQNKEYVVLIHGFASNARINWVSTKWMQFLATSGFNVIAFDHRGHGNSGNPADSKAYGADIMARDVIALLDYLKIDTAHLIGYSMGARVCAFACLQNPHRIKRVVFAGLAYNMIRGMENTKDIINALKIKTDEEEKLKYLTPVARDFRSFAVRSGNKLENMAQCLSASRKKITEQDIKNIKNKALVIAGENDTIAGNIEKFTLLLENARYVKLEKADHMKAVTNKQFFQQTLAFLQE